jgi:hypothetical protein
LQQPNKLERQFELALEQQESVASDTPLNNIAKDKDSSRNSLRN